jgi:predicted permease
MFRNYLKIAFRNTVRQRGYSILNIAGLAIGMACCILIFLWVQDERSYDRFYPDHDRIYHAYRENHRPTGDIGHSTVTPAALGPALKQMYPDIVDAARYGINMFAVGSSEKRFAEQIVFVDQSLFKIFSFEFIYGDPDKVFSDVTNIVISEEMARKHFSDGNPIGKSLRIENWYDAVITGVVKEFPGHTHLKKASVYFPFELYRPLWRRDLNDWSTNNYKTYVLLHESIDAKDLEAKIGGIIKEHHPESVSILKLRPVTDIHLHSLGGGGLITYIYIFLGMAVFILIIACINYMNLATARSSRRAREVGIRRVVGANKMQLARQFFSESIMIAFLALVFAVILVELLIPVFNGITGKHLSMDFSLNTLIMLVATAFVTGMISGVYPAIVLSSFQPVKVLKGSTGRNHGSAWFRRILVVVQFSLSIFLIIGSLVVFRQVEYIRGMDLGYDRENVIWFNMGGEIRQKFPAVKEKLLEHPAIISLTRVNTPPIWAESSVSSSNVRWEGQKAGENVAILNIMGVDPEFSETFKIEMIEGHFFDWDMPSELESGWILNETAVKAMGLESPIGARFTVWDEEGTVIGVVKDFHFSSLHDAIQPLAMKAGWGVDNIMARLADDDIQAGITHIEASLKEMIPGYSLKYRFLDDMFNEEYIAEQRSSSIMKYITILAIFISCLGLFGLASYTAEQRTREIGVRKVLGSSVSGIVLLLSKEFTRWVLIANIIAWPAAWFAANRWLQNFAYRTPVGWWIFIVSGLIALVFALLTVGFQAFKAAVINPAESLRYE